MWRALLGDRSRPAHLLGVAVAVAWGASCVGTVGPGAKAGMAGAGASGGSGGSTSSSDPTAAGVRPLRLLSGREYLNTVRDLLGDTTLSDSALPSGDEDPLATPSFAFKEPHDIATQDATLLQAAAEALAKNAVAHLSTLLPCAAPPAASAESACLNQFVSTFMPSMFRRPLLPSETTDLMNLYQLARTTLALKFNDAIGVLIEASLQSPGFLYHWELDPGPAIKDGTAVKLGNYEVANRLSYLLWGTMPDATLFSAAAAGQLGDAANVESQVRRMLKDQRAAAMWTDFFADWLDTDNLATAPKDTGVYPMFNEALTTAMTGELQSFVTAVAMTGSGRFDDLLTGTSSFANQALASLYGVSGVTGIALKPVMLDPMQRSGILTTAAFLATTGDAAESNPPRRGKAIFTKLMCGVMPPPPANVPPPAAASTGGTLRQRMEAHDMNACAAGCHGIIEPLGFAFEEFGGIGEFRTVDNNAPVDSSGMVTVDGQSHPYRNATDLVRLLAASPSVQSCFATQWLRYAFGRAETPADRASLDATTAAFTSSSGDIRELIVGLTKSRTFLYRTAAPGEVLQ